MIRRPLSRWSCRGFRASSPSSRPSRSKSATDGTSSVAISPRRGAMPSERDDASDLPVDPGRDPHITGCDVFWDDLEGGGHQRLKLRIVAPYRLRAETEIRQRGRLLDPGE